MPVAGHGPHHAALFHARRYDVFPGALNGAATNRQTQLTEPLVIHALLVRREVVDLTSEVVAQRRLLADVAQSREFYEITAGRRLSRSMGACRASLG